MRCLSLFDVTGIQDFIFSSSKAKENIGGSIYVQELFDEILVDLIKREFDDNEVIYNWEDKTSFDILTNNQLKAEIVYIGGGNAMVAFDSKNSAVKITKELSRKILEDTQGILGVVAAHYDTNFDDFYSDKKEIFKKLNENKNKYVQSTPLRGISINYECEDGLPTSGKSRETDKNVYISNVAKLKEDNSKKKDDFKSKYKFPKEFDDLCYKEGERHIAVVHIDGNSMGSFINEQIDNINDYTEAVCKMRKLSKDIRDIYKKTFQEIIDELQFAIEGEAVKKKLSIDSENRLPIRPIILNGDDVTFVCNGKIAIQIANRFLKILSGKPLTIEDKTYELSACAGIAIVKSHFPFYRAYQLAEELCSSAKNKAKALNKKNPGSWMDYHIVYSGFQLDIHSLRQEQYNVPGFDKVDLIRDYNQYHLLLRPFCVAGESEEPYQWDYLIELYHKMVHQKGKVNETKEWPRSRLKTLRNAFIESETAVKVYQEMNKSRGFCLPEYKMIGIKCSDDKNGDKIFSSYHQTPYFEVLELLDFYVPEMKLDKEAGNEN